MARSIGLLLLAVCGWLGPARAADAPPQRLMLWDCDGTAGVAGVELDSAERRQGAASVRWRHHPVTPVLNLPQVPADWSGYHVLRFQLYSGQALPTRIMVIVASENPATEGADYWGYALSLNFTGWRQIDLPIGPTVGAGARSPRGWNHIDGVALTAAGWGNTPHPRADLRLDAFELVVDPPRPGPLLSDADFFAAMDLARPGLEAVRAAVARRDLPAAKTALLAYWRERRTPKWWFEWRDRPTDVVTGGGSDGWDYYAAGVTVDWTGWRTIRIPLRAFNAARKPLGWHHINYLSFSATYGDRQPSPETVLALDSIRLEGPVPKTLADFESLDDFRRWPGLQPTTAHVRQGKQAGLWAGLPQQGGLTCRDVPRDWRPYEALTFELWSAKATGERLTVIADSDTPRLDAADRVCQHLYDGFQLGDPINWNANKTDPQDPSFTPEWTYSLNRCYHWRTLGEAYWASGDEKYAREWIAQMRSWCAACLYPRYADGNQTLTWRTIEAGIRTSTTWPDTLAYFLGSPSLTADDLVCFLKSWVEHAHHLMRITVEHPEHGGNWVTMECNGLGHLGVLLPEFREAPLWLQTAADRLYLELDRQVYADGAQKELTTGYHQVSRSNFVDLLKLARLNQVKLPEDYLRRLERMYDYNLRLMMPDGTLPPLNDSGRTHVIESLREGTELFGRDDFRWAAGGGQEGRAPDYTSTWLPYAGWAVMRSGWGVDDRYLHFEVGPYGTGHQHEDKLTVYVYGLGRVLLTEGGTYSYDRSKWRRYVLGTWSHNTICVDGQQQHRGGLQTTYETDRPSDSLWLHTPEYDAADGVYDDGYGPKREIRVTHERTVVFVRPDYWVVLDRLKGTGRHRYDVLWHLNNQAAAQQADTKAAWGTDPQVANLLVTPAARPGLRLDIVSGREDPPLGWGEMARRRPSPGLDYQIEATGDLTLAWVLTPFRGVRPEVKLTCEERPEGALVAVLTPAGTDQVLIAPRGAKGVVRLAGREVAGPVALARRVTP